MTQKEQKTLQYLERQLAAYAEMNIGESWDETYPEHNDIIRNLIKDEPFYGIDMDGAELLCRAMELAGYSPSTMYKMYKPSLMGYTYYNKFEAMLRETETYKNIVYRKQ